MLDRSIKLRMLRNMILIREFEKKVSECKEQKLIYGGSHCYNGQEAVAVGVCTALNQDDYIVSNHRPHGHAIAKGVCPKNIMAEMFGKVDGTNHGKGGSMHIHDSKVGMIAASGIVGSGIPVGCGAAFAAKQEGKNKISCVFFGDGSANEGVLHESLNLAAIWKLPILFLLEDNELAITANTRETSSCNDYVGLASAYGIEGIHVNGQNVEEVYESVMTATKHIRKTSAPFFIQAHTIRFNEHAEGPFYQRMVEKNYRDYQKLEKDVQENCPILLYIDSLKKEKELSNEELANIYQDVERAVSECVEFANLSPEPEVIQAHTDTYRGKTK